MFVISDFYRFGETEQKALAALAGKGQVFCVDVFDRLEEKAPAGGEYMAENNGKTLVFDSRPKIFKREYQAYFAGRREKVRDFCRKFNCRYMEIRTDADSFRQIKFI